MHTSEARSEDGLSSFALYTPSLPTFSHRLFFHVVIHSYRLTACLPYAYPGLLWLSSFAYRFSHLYIPPLFPLSLLSFRLYVKGVMTGFKRGLRNQHEHTSLLKIDKVVAKEDTTYYLGKRVCFIYKAQKEIRGTKFRTIWGRITRPHGSGSVFTLYLCLDAPTLHPSHLREKQQSHGSDGFA